MTPYHLIPAFVIGLLTQQSGAPELARVCSGPATAALMASVRPSDAAESPVESPARGPGILAAIDKQLTFGFLHLPRGHGASAGTCDLLIHFHGAHETTIPAFDAAGMRAALLIVNLGISAEYYVDAWSDARAFAKLLASTRKALAATLPEGEQCEIERVALSAFSAGYAAIARILNVPENVARIDSVLLADALHAPFADKLTRQIDRRGMTGITTFGRLATEGERMLSVTHSAIETESFASTTRTATELLQVLGVERVAREAAGPRRMTMKYRADKRGLHVRGYAGGDGAAHSDHLRAIGQTLFPELRERWEAR